MTPFRFSHTTSQHILTRLQYASPIIIVFFFLLAFTARSILTAKNENTIGGASDKLGPGGKPLPKKNPLRKTTFDASLDFSGSRKLLFNWLSVLVALSFLVNTANVILHIVVRRQDSWWCGRSVVVSIGIPYIFPGC